MQTCRLIVYNCKFMEQNGFAPAKTQNPLFPALRRQHSVWTPSPAHGEYPSLADLQVNPRPAHNISESVAAVPVKYGRFNGKSCNQNFIKKVDPNKFDKILKKSWLSICWKPQERLLLLLPAWLLAARTSAENQQHTCVEREHNVHVLFRDHSSRCLALC